MRGLNTPYAMARTPIAITVRMLARNAFMTPPPHALRPSTMPTSSLDSSKDFNSLHGRYGWGDLVGGHAPSSPVELTAMSSRILIVEDDPDIAQLVARYLDKAGFTTDRAASGRDALQAVTEKAPDLMVLDLMLPQVDGFEVCRRVRSNEATAALPIIMLTARGEESERIVGLELGADDYLAKPFSPNELVARVRALLRRAQRQASDAPAKTLTYGAISVDSDRHVVSAGGRDVTLTAKEFL